MKTKPLVSVVICAYNAGEFLLPSVRSILDQTHDNLEVLVVDDGSTDRSFERISIIRDNRLRVLHQENLGKPLALNRALRAISGEFYAIQDADDASYPQRIERQVRRMLDEPDLAAVFCGHDLILGNKRYAPRFREKNRAECKANIDVYRMPAHDPTAMYRVDLVRDFDYDPAFRIGQGYDYILRVGERFPMAVLGECLYSYRIHAESITKADPGKRIEMVRSLIARACERRGEDFEVLFPGRKRITQLNRIRDNSLATDFMESVVDLRSAGRWREAVATGLQCAKLHPLDPLYYRALLFAFLPDHVRRRLRPSERRQSGRHEGLVAQDTVAPHTSRSNASDSTTER